MLERPETVHVERWDMETVNCKIAVTQHNLRKCGRVNSYETREKQFKRNRKNSAEILLCEVVRVLSRRKDSAELDFFLDIPARRFFFAEWLKRHE